MLILGRRPRESIIIGDNEIIVTVLGINGNQVRIGIECDKSIPVHREEVWQRIQDQEKEVK